MTINNMKSLQNIKEALEEVYNRKMYYLYTFLVAGLMFTINALLRNYKLLFPNFSLSLFFTLLTGFPSTIPLASLINLIIISLLSGIVAAMSVFLVKRQISTRAYAGFTSLLTGVLAPACPSCALGLLTLLGLEVFLTILPFKGVELGVLAVMVLLFSLAYLSEKIVTKVCKI